jgi:hypothetical protein
VSLPMWYHNTVHRLFQDDLPSVSISPLRAAGVVTPDMERVVVAFGEGDNSLKRRVRVTHVAFRNGGSWSFFVCPVCERPARVLNHRARRALAAAWHWWHADSLWARCWAAMLGYSFVSDARPEAERMAEVLGRAIEKSTLKVGVNGEVAIAEGAEVSLKPGAKVGIDPHALLRIDPNSTVRAVGDSQVSRAGLTEQQLQPEAHADSGNPVTTSYTVFQTTKYGPGEISTSWTYSGGEAETPQRQSCYFQMNVDGAQRNLRVNIGEDGRQPAPKRRIPNVDFNDAYRLCTWFSGT